MLESVHHSIHGNARFGGRGGRGRVGGSEGEGVDQISTTTRRIELAIGLARSHGQKDPHSELKVSPIFVCGGRIGR